MSYKNEKIKRTHSGKEIVQLSVSKEILKIREAIENNEQHAGQTLELVYQAFSEIQKAHGKMPPKLDPTCSECIHTMNKLLKNWFNIFDQGSTISKAKHGNIEAKPLKPVKDKPSKRAKMEPTSKARATEDEDDFEEVETPTDYNDMNYGDLVKEFNKVATKKEKDSINGGKPPKKAQLLEYFNK